MARKVIIVADPGIDTAFALALAFQEPELDVLAVAATAGNIDAPRATENVHIVIEQIDPPRWPRVGAALPVEYDVDGTRLHGTGGLGGVSSKFGSCTNKNGMSGFFHSSRQFAISAGKSV